MRQPRCPECGSKETRIKDAWRHYPAREFCADCDVYLGEPEPDETGVVPWTDCTPLPFGKHKNVMLIDSPPSYLVWLLDGDWCRDNCKGLYRYLKIHEKEIRRGLEWERYNKSMEKARFS